MPVTAMEYPVRLASISIHSLRWETAYRQINQRFRLKTTFVIFCSLLACTIAILAILLQTRRQRFLQLKSDFIATVSHELRTPLASIRLMAETLEHRLQNNPQARDYPERMIHEIDDLTFLVDNILSFNRLDKGRWQPQISQFSLAELIQELEHDLNLFTRVPVIMNYHEDAPLLLQGDPALIQLLLRNLSKNACTYNERTPVEISIILAEEPSVWRIELTDNGIGIDPCEWQRIFIDFYRPNIASKSRGSGLGLAICRKIVHAHGGWISVLRSSSLGTTIQLSLSKKLSKNSTHETTPHSDR